MTEKMKHKVIMVAACPFPANHGSPGAIREMSEALVELGHEVHILTYPIKEDIPVIGPIIHRVNFPFLNKNKVTVGPALEKFIYDPLMVFRLIWLIWRHNIDVIHAHNYEGALIGWFAKVITRRPMLYNAVNNMVDELVTYDFIWSKKFASKLAVLLDKTIPFGGDFIIAVSDSLKEYLIKLGISEAKIQVLPCGVNAKMFASKEKADAREKYGFKADDKIVIYTGSLDHFQRIDYLLKATALLKPKIGNLKLVLSANIANPKDLQDVNQQMNDLDIADITTIVEGLPLEELPDYLALSDVATLPRTDCPGHPVKILNYMGGNVAIVGFTGAAKGLHHMKNAYLAEDHNVQQFADGIELLFSKPQIAEELASQARKTLGELYEWKVLCKGIAIIYEMLRTKDFDTKRTQLNHYIKSSYQPKFWDQRDEQSTEVQEEFQNLRTEVRRKSSKRIDFIERRKVIDAE
jgi:glycosyltransferase involved in cell wall biosynthesis